MSTYSHFSTLARARVLMSKRQFFSRVSVPYNFSLGAYTIESTLIGSCLHAYASRAEDVNFAAKMSPVYIFTFFLEL